MFTARDGCSELESTRHLAWFSDGWRIISREEAWRTLPDKWNPTVFLPLCCIYQVSASASLSRPRDGVRAGLENSDGSLKNGGILGTRDRGHCDPVRLGLRAGRAQRQAYFLARKWMVVATGKSDPKTYAWSSDLNIRIRWASQVARKSGPQSRNCKTSSSKRLVSRHSPTVPPSSSTWR